MKLHFPVTTPFRIFPDHSENGKETPINFDDGISFESSTNENVYAVYDGIVRRTTFVHPDALINTNFQCSPHYSISIEHCEETGNVFRSIYSNLSDTYVSEGEAVLKGQVIGEYANTVETEKAFLNLSIVDEEGTPINPLTFIFV